MLFNGSLFNEALINGAYSSSYDEALSEDINLSPELFYYFIDSLYEEIVLLESNGSLNIANNLITEYFNLIEKLLIILHGTTIENITLTDTLSVIKLQLEYISESITNSGSTENLIHFSNHLIALINTLDNIDFGVLEVINDILSIESSISDIYNIYNRIIDSVNLLELNSSSYIHIVSVIEESDILDLSDTLSIFKALLSDNIVISLPSISGRDTYLTYLYNPEVGGVTNYSNFNFNLSAKFKDKYLFANSVGLYEYGGKTDANSLIRAIITTPAYQFKTSNKKQIDSMYLGLDSSDTFVLKVRVDDKVEVHYKLNKFTNNLSTQKVNIGKGLIGRYFQFELITEAEDFNLESIEFLPIVIKRKL